MATGEAFVPFFDDFCVSVAYDLSSDRLVVLKRQLDSAWQILKKWKALKKQLRKRAHRHSVRKASIVEVGARPADAILDCVGEDSSDEHGEEQACKFSHRIIHLFRDDKSSYLNELTRLQSEQLNSCSAGITCLVWRDAGRRHSSS